MAFCSSRDKSPDEDEDEDEDDAAGVEAGAGASEEDEAGVEAASDEDDDSVSSTCWDATFAAFELLSALSLSAETAPSSLLPESPVGTR